MDFAERARAIADIQSIFGTYRAAQPSDQMFLTALTDGKLYELFVLSDLLSDLSNRGFTLTFVGLMSSTSTSTLKFKSAPGKIKISDSHFEVRAPNSQRVDYRIFTDIEFDTLGHGQHPVTDNSRRHELDIIVTSVQSDYPTYGEIALAVECKAVANFHKGLIKEALGVRRELSLLDGPNISVLSMHNAVRSSLRVPADPPSEFRFAFIDPKGKNYSQSPSVFGIEFRHLQP